MRRALVSIGMPVYNAEKHLRAAVDCMLAQTFTDFELIISDNASTDATEALCRGYAAVDPRIRYVRQPHNLGATHNFQFVLDQAQGEFFMWAAADDIRSPDFLEINLEFLQAHSDFVASTCPVRFDNGEFNERNMGDGSLVTSAPRRFIAMFRAFHANGRFFALLRRAAVKDCRYLTANYLGCDWAVVLHLALQGKFNRSPRGWVVMGSKGLSATQDIFRIFRKSRLDFFFPFHQLASAAWRLSPDFPWPDRVLLALALALMNVKGFLGQFDTMLRRRGRAPV